MVVADGGGVDGGGDNRQGCGGGEGVGVSSDPKDINYTKTKYVLIADDDTFPQQKLDLTLPMSLKGQRRRLIGSSHGLLCFSCKKLVVMWNPTIRKAVSIDVPDLIILHYETMYGFGVCPVTYDIKLVKMIFNNKLGESCTIEVFTLSSGVWRSPHGNLPRKSVCIARSHLNIDGCIYWDAFDHIRLPSGFFQRSKLIISFSTTSEEFTEISYPNSLALKGNCLGITM
ncbi:putative F-box domain-containing protein [Tanacetum coccineum]